MASKLFKTHLFANCKNTTGEFFLILFFYTYPNFASDLSNTLKKKLEQMDQKTGKVYNVTKN